MTTPVKNNAGTNAEFNSSLGPFQKRINANALTIRVWDSDTDLMGRAKSKVPTSHSWLVRRQTEGLHA